MFTSERAVDGMALHLRGKGWALDASLEKLREVVIQRKPVHNFTLTEFDFDVTVASIVIRVLQVNASFMESLTLHDCTGHTELVVAVAMTMESLKKMVVSIGRLAPAASTPLMNALGVGLQISPNLKELVIQSGSNVFFTLDPEAAESLEAGLGNARMGTVESKLERFTLKCCRFAEPSAVRSLATGLHRNRGLRHVNLQSCYSNNGHPLDDASLSRIIQALAHNPNLCSLNVQGNKCLQKSVEALAQLINCTRLERLNLSSQVIESDYNEFLDVSLLVVALARTTTLKSLDLRFNKLGDEAMAYLVAALAQNRSLEYLGLASNKIQNTGISILAFKIAEMKGLRQLVLTNNPFDDTATLELAEALDTSDNWTLEALECGGPGRKIKHDKLQHNVDLNWAGRRLLKSKDQETIKTRNLTGGRYCSSSHCHNVPPGLWPLIVERVNRRLVPPPPRPGKMPPPPCTEINGIERCAGILFYFLREGPLGLER